MFSFKRLGISNSDFNKDMTQTERNWFQRQIFDLFTDRELNNSLRQNVSLSLTRYENFIGCMKSKKQHF